MDRAIEIVLVAIASGAVATFAKWFSGKTWADFASSTWKGITSMGLFSSIRLWLSVAALVGSFGSGVYVTHWYYKVDQLASENSLYAKNVKRMKVVLGLNEKIDTADADVEKSNQEVLDELQATKVKADRAPLIQKVSVEVPAKCPEAKPNPVCLTDAGMRKLSKLK